ncbi:MAG: hypothetical protein RL459_1529 [Pseudomonadota bacterium]|jgi:hypothetical protein
MKTLSLALLLALSGCATPTFITVRVESNPTGAQVDVNQLKVGTTPVDVSMQCTKTWVGVANSPDGWLTGGTNYVVTVYPQAGSGGTSQTKTVNPCIWRGGGSAVVAFDLGLEKVQPKQRIDLNITRSTSDPKVFESIESLKRLKAQGLLTEAEYNEKVLKAVSGQGAKAN